MADNKNTNPDTGELTESEAAAVAGGVESIHGTGSAGMLDGSVRAVSTSIRTDRPGDIEGSAPGFGSFTPAIR